MIDLSTRASVLVRAPNWVGDAVMALPFVAALQHGLPGRRIAVAARPHAGDIMRLLPGVEVIEHDDRGRDRGPRGWLKLARRLRAERFEAAFLLPGSLSSALIAWLAGIRIRVGYARDGRGPLLTHPVAWSGPTVTMHRSASYLALLDAAGIARPAVARLPEGLVAEAARGEASAVLAARGVGVSDRLFGIAPGAVGVSRRWPAERFAQVARRLAVELGARVLVLGGPGDVPLCREVSAALGTDSVDLGGRTPLGLLPALLDRCDLLVSNDSGAAHVAAVSGTPVVVLFGAGDESITGPLGGRVRVLRRDLECTPCQSNTCARGDLACLTAIECEAVVEAALQIARGPI